MSFIGDIELDVKGNSVISGGELNLTISNLNFVLRSLRYGSDSFKLNSEIGFGLDKYIGEKNNLALHQKMIVELKDYFELHAITLDINVLPTGNNTVAIEIILLLEDLRIIFTFDLESGILIFEDDVKDIDEDISLISPTDNKYLARA